MHIIQKITKTTKKSYLIVSYRKRLLLYQISANFNRCLSLDCIFTDDVYARFHVDDDKKNRQIKSSQMRIDMDMRFFRIFTFDSDDNKK